MLNTEDGAFANVCRAHSLQENSSSSSGRGGGGVATTFAAKFCSRRRSGLDCTSEIHHEIALLSLCSPSPRIVRLHDVFQTQDQFIILMEYAPGGDMQTLIDNNVVPYEADVVRFVQHVVEALAYLHHRRIAHLDIKPQNLVLMGDFPHCDVKVCDFEISRVILDGSEIHEILGTPEYVAPEILHYEPITLAADMWSLGVTVYVLLTGFSPFGGETDQETFLNISRAQLDFPDELFDDVSEHAKDFIRKLLKRNPKDRMTAKQCLRHPWLATNKSGGAGRRTPSTSSPPSATSGGKRPVSATSGGHNSQLRKYLSKSREALFERVVAKQMAATSPQPPAAPGATGRTTRYDRTRRLCESQMSLVSRSREQLLLTGQKRCLSRDKLYGIRHLSKSHEVLNSLAGALVVAQQEQEGVGPGDVEEDGRGTSIQGDTTTKDVALHQQTSLQTVLTLICDSKNNTKVQSFSKDNVSTMNTNQQPEPNSPSTASSPSTPDTEQSSKVLLAIGKLEMTMNERNNNNIKSSAGNNNRQEKYNKTNNTGKSDDDSKRVTADPNKMAVEIDSKVATSGKADPNKMAAEIDSKMAASVKADPNKMAVEIDSKMATNEKAEPNKVIEIVNKVAISVKGDQNKMAEIENKMSITSKTDQNLAKTHSTDYNMVDNTITTTVLLDRNKMSCSEQDKMAPSITAHQNKMAAFTTADQNKMAATTTADQNKMATTTTADQNRMAASTTADQNKMDASTTAYQDKMAASTTAEEDLNKMAPHTTADQNKMAATTTADPDSGDQIKMAATPTPVQNKMAALVDVETKMTSPIGEKRCERPCLLFTKQPVDLWSPGGGGTSGWSPTSSEEPDSGHSTWQRIVMAEEDEPRFTVAQLISAFNKHQALVTKTSLEVTMNIRGGAPESKILPDEVSNHTTNQKFPIGPEALRLFIPGIKISDNNKSSKTISPTTPPPDNMTTKSVANPTNKETDVEQTNNREKTKKVENTSKKPTNPSSPTRVDCNADFSPPTPPPPPPALSSEQTRNYKTSDVRTTRHRTSGRQATTLAASNKIRKKSNTTAKPPPFY